MAGKQLFANNGKGKLNAGIIAGDTQLTLQAGQGALFPAPAGGDWFKVTLIKGDGSIEIVKCTARAGDVLNPIVRAQEGTVAIAFNAADKVECRWTRDSANQFQQRTDIQTNIARYAGVAGGTANALTATIASDLTALVDGLKVDIEGLSANSTTTPTLNLTLGVTATGAKTIKKFSGSPLAAGDIAGPGHRIMFQYRSADDSWLILNPAAALSRALLAVRQAIQAAKLDASGYNVAFAAGTGLAVDLSATATPMNMSFANGFDSQGPVELVTQLTADAASAVASLSASNTTFLHATWVSLSSVTWSKCLVPPQYGSAFDRGQGALLNFEAANGSTNMADDWGNSWTPSGNAQITTAQFKFGTASLVLDGTGDYINTGNITSVGDGSWEVSLWFRINALPGVGVRGELFSFYNSGGFGAIVSLLNTAGTSKLLVILSSNGTSQDISAGTNGTNTVWTLNQWNKVRMVFDALAGTYRVYLSLNGAAETQDITISSSARICAVTGTRIGADSSGNNGFNGWIDAVRFVRCATNTSTETPSGSAPTIADFPVHFFSIPKMTMFEVTGASSGSGIDPAMTQRNRVFAGEADTGAGAVSAVRNYALRGRYRSALQAPKYPGGAVAVNFAANLGVKFGVRTSSKAVCVTSNNGYVLGNEVDVLAYSDAANNQYYQPHTYPKDRNNVAWRSGTSGTLSFSASGATTLGLQGLAEFGYYVEAERTW